MVEASFFIELIALGSRFSGCHEVLGVVVTDFVGVVFINGGVIDGRDAKIFISGIGVSETDGVVVVDGLVDETVVTIIVVVVDDNAVNGEAAEEEGALV
ncbi:hypothetical protein NDU88_006926 [Pleurodeles waltl]|uniref:Uncharacterized protein n=1 Tax=Pleurodeles waltl TaxID=8319 RepID=A0AAV7LTC1_PLEWA|nr:hypothetical protein NDU88_006926 [Pleurodeles waltl]